MNMVPGDQEPTNVNADPDHAVNRHPALDDRPSPFAEPDKPRRSEPRGDCNVRSNPLLTMAAWFIIIVISIGMAVLAHIGAGGDGALAPVKAEEDPGVAVFRLQARMTVGLGSGSPGIEDQIETFEIGTVPQRQRFLPYVAEMLGPVEAKEATQRLRDQMEAFGEPRELYMTEGQIEVQRILEQMYRPAAPGETIDLVARVEELTPAERDVVLQELGWFGSLALNPEGTPDQAERDDIMAQSERTIVLTTVVFIGAICLGVIGFAGLVWLIVAAITKRLRSGMVTHGQRGGIYAETFAVWLIIFLLGNLLVVPIVATMIPDFTLLCAGIWFFVSLIALVWPVVRGIPWATVRTDIGLTLGRLPAAEPLLGVAGYAMTLPILALGVLMTLVLITIQAALQEGSVSSFTPAGGGAHPIVGQVAGGDLMIILQVLFVAAVAAPVVEETMFRGVLYRHLREATGKAGFAMSFLSSAVINSFIFAMIHPQGWVAIPALMGLALGFTMMREWRGTLIPSILVHGISNFLVMMMLTLAMS